MIQITLDLRGAQEVIANSKRIQGLVSKTVLNAMRRVVRRHVTKVKQDIRSQSGIGRRIWGKNAAGLNPIVSLIRARITGDTIETGIKLKGLPVLIEEGGQTKPFDVKHPYGNPFAKKARHPGSRVRAHQFAHVQRQLAGPAIVREVGEALGKLVGNERGLQP